MAVIAALAALLGSSVGGTATLWAARAQTSGQQDTELAKFVREERKLLYLQIAEKLFVLEAIDLDVWNEVLMPERHSKATPSTEVVRALTSRYVKAFEEIQPLRVRMELFSSEATIEKFDALRDARYLVDSLLGLLTEVLEGRSEMVASNLIAEVWSVFENTGPLSGLDNEMLTSARSELGVR